MWSSVLWNLLYSYVLPSLVIILAPALGKVMYDYASVHLKNATLKNLFDHGALAVSAVHQEYVVKIKEGMADGKLTQPEALYAKQCAIKKLIELVGGTISESVAGTVIESVLDASKNNNSATKVGL